MNSEQQNRIGEALTAYHMGKEDTIMTLHKIGVIVGHKMPQSWSFSDFEKGREDNHIPLSA